MAVASAPLRLTAVARRRTFRENWDFSGNGMKAVGFAFLF